MKDKQQPKNRKTPNTQNTNQTDSYTGVNTVFAGRRRVVGFRCNENLWKSLKTLAEAEGASVCHFLEAIIAGVLAAEKTPVNTRKTIVIKELHVTREVKRARRYAREEVAGVGGGVVLVDYYDGDLTLWRRVSADEFGVNLNGHGVGCACAMCRPRKKGVGALSPSVY